jgi:Mg-chelatase subunit ChlD
MVTKKKTPPLPARDEKGRFLSSTPSSRPSRKPSRTTKTAKPVASPATVDVAFSIDTTGSMDPVAKQVRRHATETSKYILAQVPNARVAIILHGDYCDGAKMLSVQDFTNDFAKIERFLRDTPSTSGGDSPEAYEAALNRARSLSWNVHASAKALVLMGDDKPHHVGYTYGGHTNRLDWRLEAMALRDSGVKVFPIQCLHEKYANEFYQGLASISSTPYLELAQYSDVNGTLMAIIMQQAGRLDQYERDYKKTFTVQQKRVVDQLAGRKVEPIKKSALSPYAVHPSRFQMFIVDKRTRIDEFVREQGLHYEVGRGFYEFTKPEEVQAHKEVVLQDKATGEMFAGPKAKEILGIPSHAWAPDTKLKPKELTEVLVKYAGFIQSTSLNRILIPGTRFLYDTFTHL